MRVMGRERAIQSDPARRTALGPQPKAASRREGPLMKWTGESLASAADTESFDQRIEAEESERRRLLQELHDSTGYLFIELNMEIGKLRGSLGLENAAELIHGIEE